METGSVSAQFPLANASATLVGSIVAAAPALTALEKLQIRANPLRQHQVNVKLLLGEAHLPAQKIATIFDLKLALCEGTGMIPADLLVVCGGKELKDDQVFVHSNSNIYALVRSSASSILTIPVQCKESSCAHSSISVPANMKVFQLEKEIHKQKLVPMRPSAQRLMIGARTLSDEMGYVGNYILSAVNRRRGSSSSLPSLYVTRTMDRKHEVNVALTLAQSKKVLDFSLEIGTPLTTIRTILAKQFFFPDHLGELRYYLSVCGGEYVKMDTSKTLLDYGITAASKRIQVVSFLERDALTMDLTGVPVSVFLSDSPATSKPSSSSSSSSSTSSSLNSCPRSGASPASTPSKAPLKGFLVAKANDNSSGSGSKTSSPTTVAVSSSPSSSPSPSATSTSTSVVDAAKLKKKPDAAVGKDSKSLFRGMKRGFLTASASSSSSSSTSSNKSAKQSSSAMRASQSSDASSR